MKRPAHGEKTLGAHSTAGAASALISPCALHLLSAFPAKPKTISSNCCNGWKSAQLDRVGCFQYSPVEGATANALPNAVPDDIKQDRWERFMATAQKISAAKMQQKIGREIDVLIDEVDEDGAIGRSKADAPEIDGAVYLNDATHLQAGQIVRARVDEADEYDLWASLI
jgi:ribosomal protein S12 methylthiotransferase